MWAYRSVIPVSYGVMLFALVVSGGYYWAASFVFPDVPADGIDFDDHFVANQRKVYVPILVISTITLVVLSMLSKAGPGRAQLALILVNWLAMLVAIVSGSKWVNAAMLAILIGVYAFRGVIAEARP